MEFFNLLLKYKSILAKSERIKYLISYIKSKTSNLKMRLSYLNSGLFFTIFNSAAKNFKSEIKTSEYVEISKAEGALFLGKEKIKIKARKCIKDVI